jgi:hypothetical protein
MGGRIREGVRRIRARRGRGFAERVELIEAVD